MSATAGSSASAARVRPFSTNSRAATRLPAPAGPVEGEGDFVLRYHPAGRLDEYRAADTAQFAARVRLGTAGREAIPVGLGQRLVHTGAVIAAVVFGDDGAGRQTPGKSITRN